MIEKNEIRYKEYFMEDAQICRGVDLGLPVGWHYRLSAQPCRRHSVGLFRPISLSPSPKSKFSNYRKNYRGLFVVEMNSGMMWMMLCWLHRGRVPVEFYGRMGGIMPFPGRDIA